MFQTIKIKDDGFLLISGVTYNCMVNQINIDGQIVMEENTVLLTSGKEKTFNGFDDSDIKIYATILEATDGGEERYKDLQLLNYAFKTIRYGQPVVYSLEGKLFKALQIKACIFNGLSIDQSLDDSILVVISLTEHEPVVKKVQAQQGSVSSEANVSVEPAQMSKSQIKKLEKLESYYNE